MPNINMKSTHMKHEEETIQMHCDICLTDYTFHKNEKLRPASICYPCWSNHIRTFLTRISYQVGNPILAVGEGEEPIDVCEAINSLKDDERNELEEWLFKKYTTFTPDIEKCPSETCDFVFTMQKCRWKANEELCPKCETKLSTDKKLQIRSLAGIIYFILIANKCPKCEIPIEKTSGCPHMSCPCGHQFCWFCLKDHHQNGRNLYAVHEAKECFSVVVSKVLILMMCLTSLIISCSGNDSSKGLFSIFIYCVVGFLKALLLNFVLAINVVTVNHFFYIYKYRWNKKAFAVGLGLLLCMDLAFLLGLNCCDLLEDILSIFFFEVTLVAIGGALFWIGYHLYETWFEYIA